jgi:hypothetical protein
MRIAVLFFFLSAFTIAASAQRSARPAFGSYPAAVEPARAKGINFRLSPDARTFRTRLREALRTGVNFAGHYVVAGWGCGTGCVNGAIIDARDGRVFFPEELAGIAVGHSDAGYADPVIYRKNSRLLMISGIPGNSAEGRPEKPSGKYFYEWRNNRFHLVKYIKGD